MQETEITIAQMQEQDTAAAAEIEAAVCSMPWSGQGFSDALKQDTLFLTAKQNGKVAGYCGMYCAFEEGEITNVAVAPKQQKQGIGRKLVSCLLEQGKQRGIERIVLEVRVSNAPAIKLYESFGFWHAGIRKGFYEKPREDALIMVLELIPTSK